MASGTIGIAINIAAIGNLQVELPTYPPDSRNITQIWPKGQELWQHFPPRP